MSEERVIELWHEAMALPNTTRKVELLQEAVRASDTAQWEEGSYQSRAHLMQAAELSGHGDRVLVAFSWCLAKSDEKPDEFPESSLLWNYKWAIYNSFLFPQVDRDRCMALINDYEHRLRRNHYSTRPAAYLRMQYLMQTGCVTDALETLPEWTALPRDEFADCAACELDNRVELHCCAGDDAKARATAEPIVNGALSCAEIPHRTYGRLVASGLRSGSDETHELFRQGYRICQGELDFLAPLGMFGLLIARNRNMAASLGYLKRHLPIAAGARNPRELLDFYAGATAVARSLDAVTVRAHLPPDHGLQSCDRLTGAAVAQWLQQEALQLAAEFDRRNGNDWVSSSWKQLLELAKP